MHYNYRVGLLKGLPPTLKNINMTTASEIAYQENKTKFKSNKEQIFEYLKECRYNGITIADIVNVLNIQKVTAGGRLSELWNEGKVTIVGTKKIGSSRYSKYVPVLSKETQIKLRDSRRREKYLDLKRKMAKYKDLMPSGLSEWF